MLKHWPILRTAGMLPGMDDLLIHGGPVLWLQALMAFFAVVFVIERLLYFHGVRINAADFLKGIANHVRAQGPFAGGDLRGVPVPGSGGPGGTQRVDSASHGACRSPGYRGGSGVPRSAADREEPEGPLGDRAACPAGRHAGDRAGFDRCLHGDQRTGRSDDPGGDGRRDLREPRDHGGGSDHCYRVLCVFTSPWWARGKRLLARLERTGIEVVNLIADARSQSEIVSFRDELEAREKASLLDKRADAQNQ